MEVGRDNCRKILITLMFRWAGNEWPRDDWAPFVKLQMTYGDWNKPVSLEYRHEASALVRAKYPQNREDGSFAASRLDSRWRQSPHFLVSMSLVHSRIYFESLASGYSKMPRPDFRPSLPALTYCTRSGAGRYFSPRDFWRYSRMLRRVSRPTRSTSSNGPIG